VTPDREAPRSRRVRKLLLKHEKAVLDHPNPNDFCIGHTSDGGHVLYLVGRLIQWVILPHSQATTLRRLNTVLYNLHIAGTEEIEKTG
jgi:hypothetical protein